MSVLPSQEGCYTMAATSANADDSSAERISYPGGSANMKTHTARPKKDTK